MTDEEKGVQTDPEVPPTSDESGESASPPEDIEFEDDQIQEVEGERLVPLDVAKAERKKRQELEKKLAEATQPAPEVPEGEPVPEFDWDKLMGREQQQPQNPDQQAFEQFSENFRDMVEDNPWQAMATAFHAFQQQQDKMQSQARQFAPDYDKLPVHQVTDEEIMAVSQNPHALRALIAKAKGSPGASTPAETRSTPAAQPMDEKQRWIEEGRKQERELLAQMAKGAGTAGESTSGPTTAPAGDVLELDEASKQYFRKRGYTDEQISKMASKVLEERRRKGLAI
jgi:hypothetical protein